MKKYEMLEEYDNITLYSNKVLYRIRALRDIPEYQIKKGDLGGLIEFEHNLSQKDNCWIFDDAVVCDMATVDGNARIFNNVIVCDKATVDGNARIFNNVVVCDNAQVYGCAYICDNVMLSGKTIVRKVGYIKGNIKIEGDIKIEGFVQLINGKLSLRLSKDNFICFNNVLGAYLGVVLSRPNEMWLIDEYQLTTDEFIDYIYKNWDSTAFQHIRTCYDSNIENIVNYIKFIVNFYKNQTINKKVKKYELTKNFTLKPYSKKIKLYQIRALIDIPLHGVQKGDLGGFIESEKNLSHEGSCWVGDTAIVHDDAMVSDNAIVSDKARVSKCAMVFGNAKVNGGAVSGGSIVFEDAKLSGYGLCISGFSKIYGKSEISGSIYICNSDIFALSNISGSGSIVNSVKICGNAKINNDFYIGDGATIDGNVNLSDAIIEGVVKIHNQHDFIVFKGPKFYDKAITWVKANNKWSLNDFTGSADELLMYVKNDPIGSGIEYDCVVKYVNSILSEDKNKQQTI